MTSLLPCLRISRLACRSIEGPTWLPLLSCSSPHSFSPSKALLQPRRHPHRRHHSHRCLRWRPALGSRAASACVCSTRRGSAMSTQAMRPAARSPISGGDTTACLRTSFHGACLLSMAFARSRVRVSTASTRATIQNFHGRNRLGPYFLPRRLRRHCRHPPSLFPHPRRRPHLHPSQHRQRYQCHRPHRRLRWRPALGSMVASTCAFSTRRSSAMSTQTTRPAATSPTSGGAPPACSRTCMLGACLLMVFARSRARARLATLRLRRSRLSLQFHKYLRLGRRFRQGLRRAPARRPRRPPPCISVP